MRPRQPLSIDTQATVERRVFPRLEAGWIGKCRLADDPSSASFECKILDISTSGAGIEVIQIPQLEVGQNVSVTAQPMSGSSISIRFTGTIRSERPMAAKTEYRRGVSGRRLRIGIEFTDLSDEESALLEAISRFFKSA